MLIGAAALTGLLLGGVAYGRPCDGPVDAAGSAPPSVLVVMDASRSMAKPADGGRSRLDAAKASLRTLVDGLPNGARVGLRLYGHRVSGVSRTTGCRDTELVTAVAELDRAALKSRIEAYRAVGFTPIGRALRAGARDLPATGTASIVLVSDGGDNCAPPNPCRVAEQIAAARRTVSIQTIGFQVAGRAREQLRCIAAHGRGVYRDAENAEELAVALRALSARAMRTFEPEGASIVGGASALAARPIGAGRFVDRIRPEGERWYTLALHPGQRLAAAAVVIARCPADIGLADMIGTSIQLDVFGPGRASPQQRTGTANLFFGDESIEGTGLLTPRVGPKRDALEGFLRPGRYTLRVALADSSGGSLARAFGDAPLPLQIETRVIGDEPSDPPATGRAAARGNDAGTLVAIVAAAAALGVIAGLVLARRRRRGRA